MKAGRILLIVLGVIVVLAAVAVGVALIPGVQRWAVLRAVRDIPGMKLDVERVSAGFSGAQLDKVRFEQDQLVITCDRMEADFSPLAYVFSSRLDIDRLAIAGLNVDASHFASAKTKEAAASAPATVPGILAQVQLPFDLSLDNVRVEGRGLLPGRANQAPLPAQFTLTGGKFATGQEGLLQLTAVVQDSAKDTLVTALRAQIGLRATLTAQRRFDKVSLTTVVDAEGPTLAGQSQLKVGADLLQKPDGEYYDIKVDTLLKGTTENVLKLQAKLPAGSHDYSGDWELNARTAQIEPFALGIPLPEFDISGRGNFVLNPVSGAFALKGGAKGKVDRMESINPAWKAFGAVDLDATFDGNRAGDVLQLTQARLALAGAKPVLDVQAVAPLRYDLAKNQLLGSGQPSENLLRVNLTALPIDWIRPFVEGIDLKGGAVSGQFDVARVPDAAAGATVRGSFTIPDLTVSQGNEPPLLTRATVTLRTDATLRDSLLEAPVVALTVKTADGDTLDLNGKLSARLENDYPLALTAKFNAGSTQTFARWLPGAPVKAQGDLDLALQGKKLEVKAGRVQVEHAGKSLFETTALQAFGVDLNTHAITPRDRAVSVLKVTLGRIPLGLLPVTGPDATLDGFVQQGEFEVAVPNGKVVARSVVPLRLSDIALSQNRQPALTGLSLEASPVVEYEGPEKLRFESGDVSLRTTKSSLMTLKAEATQAPGKGMQATLTFGLEVPALASQPLFANARTVSAGKASGEVRAVFDRDQQIEARITLNGLIAAENGHVLPVANIGYRSVVQANGGLSIQVPILLDSAGRRSDLNFSLELAPPAGQVRTVSGKVTGQRIELEDTLGVLGVFMAAAAPETADTPPPATGTVRPDTTAAWSKFSGRLSLDVKSVTRGTEWTMSDLTGEVAIEPAALSLQKLQASFNEKSRLTAKMEMKFNGGPMPYRLTGNYSLNDFDVGKLFKAFDPGKPPTVDGLFSMQGTVAGNGETPSRAIDRLHGEFQMTSRQGVFRGLARTSAKVSMTSKAVEIGASVLGSLFGSDKGTKTAEKVAGMAYYADQLAQSLAELNYDLLSVKLSRDELLNMNLEEIGLVAQEVRLTGRGDVTYVSGKTLLEQPLTASLNLAARGKVEELLNKARLLDGTKDELGYARAKETVTLGGTLGKPDPTAFFTRIAAAKISDLLDNSGKSEPAAEPKPEAKPEPQTEP